MAAYDLSLATEMYAKDSDTGGIQLLYQTLYDGENRIASDKRPDTSEPAGCGGGHRGQALLQATRAWIGRAPPALLLSTHHRQRRTGRVYHHPADSSRTSPATTRTTVKRKVMEIYRALAAGKASTSKDVHPRGLSQHDLPRRDRATARRPRRRTYFGKDAQPICPLAESAVPHRHHQQPLHAMTLCISDWTLREQPQPPAAGAGEYVQAGHDQGEGGL